MVHCSSRKFCQMFCIPRRELLSVQIKSPSFKIQTGQVTFCCFLNFIMKKNDRERMQMFFSESTHKPRNIFSSCPRSGMWGEICFVDVPLEHEKGCWKEPWQGMGTSLRIAFSLKKGYLLQQHHSQHDWAAQTMTGAEIQKMQQYEPFQIPLTQNRLGKELSHTPWHSLLLLHKALTQLSRSKIKLIWKLCRWEMYHIWHLLQPFWKQGGWSRKHHSPLPQTQFLHLASRPQWRSLSQELLPLLCSFTPPLLRSFRQ